MLPQARWRVAIVLLVLLTWILMRQLNALLAVPVLSVNPPKPRAHNATASGRLLMAYPAKNALCAETDGLPIRIRAIACRRVEKVTFASQLTTHAERVRVVGILPALANGRQTASNAHRTPSPMEMEKLKEGTAYAAMATMATPPFFGRPCLHCSQTTTQTRTRQAVAV